MWDAPTRLVHWLFVFCVAFSWWTVENDRMDWHYLSGLTLLGLLVFRIYWGFAGPETARFAKPGFNIVGAVQVRVVDQPLPSDGGPRLLKVDPHDQVKLILQSHAEPVQSGGILHRGHRIVNRARTDTTKRRGSS